jgi:uncharacterized protein YjbI with pentapeptide repeats
LTGANFADAIVRGAKFYDSVLTAAQLYSTASYDAHDLTGIGLGGPSAGSMTGWNFAGQNLTDAIIGGSVDGADFTNAEIRGASFVELALSQLYSTASYQAHDLTGVRLSYNNLEGANFTNQNLTDAGFFGARLAGAHFTGAQIRGVVFTSSDFSLAQLYSTANYQAGDLSGVDLNSLDLSGANFAGMNLTNSNLQSILTGANLAGADARGAQLYVAPGQAFAANLIQLSGQIEGLDLTGGQSLVIRDYDGGVPVWRPDPLPPEDRDILVLQHFNMGDDGVLKIVLEADAWDSLISFADGILVTLGGTLELTFAQGLNLAGQVGRTFDLFDWTGVDPTGAFTVSSPYSWDIANLYTTGEVTLLATPGLEGDFNEDGSVDAADYIVWRKGLGTTHTLNDYEVWRIHFGQTAFSGAAPPSAEPLSAAVPEPLALTLLVFGALALFPPHRRR